MIIENYEKLKNIGVERFKIETDTSSWRGHHTKIINRVVIIGRILDKIFNRSEHLIYTLSKERIDVNLLIIDKKPIINITLSSIENDLLNYLENCID